MISFNIYRKGKLVRQLSTDGTLLFGQDEIPVRSQLEFGDNRLIASRQGDAAVGLVIMWEVHNYGKILQQTTRLPERQAPYNLNLELVRGKLLRVSLKREEWGMIDLETADEHQELVNAALDKFISALCQAADEPDKASLLADEALSLAVKGGETMALAHAKLFLDRRSNTQGFGRHSFGCCFDPSRIQDQKYLKYIKDNFRFVTVPISWRKIQPKEQEKEFKFLDECINWLSRNHIAVKVGPLISFSPTAVPDWLYIWENDFEQIREMAYEYITEVVTRYKTKVQAWDVASGLNAENTFKFSFEQIIEMTRSAALAAKHAAPRSLMLIEITEPWGEYFAYNQRTIPPIIYVDMIHQSGVTFDGLSVKLRFGRGGGGMRTRDLLEVACLLDRISLFGKPIHLTSVQVPSQPDSRDNQGRIGEAGYWHDGWNEQSQAQWLEQIYQIALSRPLIETVTWQDLADREDGVLQYGGLLTKDLSPKPAFETLNKLRKNLVREHISRSANYKNT